jgi:hypothetical protein
MKCPHCNGEVDDGYAQSDARQEHAWRMRREGLLWREVGARLGVSSARAQQLARVIARQYRIVEYRKALG